MSQDIDSIIDLASKKLETCLAEVEELKTFIRRLKEFAQEHDEAEDESNDTDDEPLKTKTMEEWVRWSHAVIKHKGKVDSTRWLVSFAKKKGYTVERKSLAAFLSQRKDLFKYDKEDGGWSTVTATVARGEAL